MFRRPARDRNYEFWGDQTFFGENPPGAAIISWLNKKQVGEVKLRITDAAGREVREISGTPLANSNKAGHSDRRAGICACSRTRAAAGGGRPGRRRRDGRRRQGERRRTGRRRGGQSRRRRARSAPAVRSPTLAAAAADSAAAPNVNGPYVIGGVYTVSLVVDGKTIESKPLRVNEDPEVVLTAVERKRMFDQAMEIHALQPRLIEATTAHAALTRQLADVDDGDRGEERRAGGRQGVGGGVDERGRGAWRRELAAPAGGRGGGGGRGQNESLSAKLGQAKNGLTAGMSPADPTVRAYTEVKAQTPRAIADLNAVIAKAATLSTTLARYNVTLTVPAPVALAGGRSAARRN